MLKTPSVEPSKEIANPNIDVELIVGDAVGPKVHMMFPPVPQLLRGQPVSTRLERRPEAEFSGLPVKAIEKELLLLLEKYDEYQHSETYLTRIASLAFLIKDNDRAEEFATQAAEINDNPEFRFRLAEYVWHGQKSGIAPNIWEKLVGEGHVLSALRLAEIALAENDIDRATEYVDRALEMDDDDWRVQLLAGVIKLVARNYKRAIRHFRVVHKDRLRPSRMYHYLALAHVLSGNLKHALKDLRISLGLNPFNSNVLTTLADLSVSAELELEFTARILDRYTALYGDDKAIMYRLAHVQYLRQDFASARKLLSEAKKKCHDASISNNLGVLDIESKNIGAAISLFANAFKEATSSNDDRIANIAAVNLVATLSGAHRYEEIIDFVEHFIESHSDKHYLRDDQLSRVVDTLVHAYLNTGQVEKAIQFSETLLREQDINPRLCIELKTTLVCYFTLSVQELDKAMELAESALTTLETLDLPIPELQNTVLNNPRFCTR